jgi:hypothetical protein
MHNDTTSEALDSLLLELGPNVGLVVNPDKSPAEWTVVPLHVEEEAS